MNVILKIFQLGNLLAVLLLPTLELALKIKQLFSLDPDFQVNITNLAGEALAADDATDAAIAAWRKRVGLPDQPPSSGPKAISA